MIGLTPAFHIKNKRGKISEAKTVRNIVAFFLHLDLRSFRELRG